MNKLLLSFLLLITMNAFSQSGEIDPTFGINGKVTTGFGTNTNMARCVAFQPDGKFIVGGNYLSSRGDNDFALARYNNDGTLDLTFGVAGKAVTNFMEINNTGNSILSLHVLPDEKILAMGSTAQGNVPNIAIVRYNSNGTIDTSFGNNGKIISPLAPMDISGFGGSLVLQPDGKIIVAGLKLINFDPNYYTGLERYSEDGLLDETFGTAGQAVASYGNGKSYPSSIAIQPDGKIVVGGKYMQTNISIMSAMRFTSNGVLDPSFDGDGKLTTSFGAGTIGEGMHVSIDGNGKITLAGLVFSNTSRSFGMIRYNANGSLDLTFDGDGKALTAYDLNDDYALVNSLTKQSDGKYLAVFKVTNYMLTAANFVVRRYNVDTSADLTFGTNGQISTAFDTGLNEAQSATISPNGKIVVVGKSVPLLYDHIDFAVARYSADGILDATLDGDGKLVTAFEKGNDRMKKLLILPNDKILAVGISDYRNANNSTAREIIFSKYNSNGTLDTSFGNLGKVLSVLGTQLNTISAAALQPDGKIVLGNMYYNFMDTGYSYELLRYNADGTLDVTFGTNGKKAITYFAESIVFRADGKIIVAGDGTVDGTNYGYVVCRYNTDGTADTSFGGDGSTAISFGEQNYGKATVMLQSDNKIVLSGSTFTSDGGGIIRFATARFNSGGSLDTTFGNNGTIQTTIGGGSFALNAFVQPDGKIIVAGKSYGDGGLINFSSIRYETNGMIDLTYGTNGISSCGLWYDYKEINGILLQADGKLLVVLTLQNQPEGTYDFKLRRFNNDGTYDNDFGGNYGVTTSFYGGYDEAFSIGLQSDDKIVLGGTTHNGINYDFALTRYDNLILGLHGNTIDPATVILYPNPVEDVLHIKSDALGSEIIDYSIYTILGQLVCNESYSKQGIETSNLSRGIYAIVIRTSEGNVCKKFVKE